MFKTNLLYVAGSRPVRPSECYPVPKTRKKPSPLFNLLKFGVLGVALQCTWLPCSSE